MVYGVRELVTETAERSGLGRVEALDLWEAMVGVIDETFAGGKGVHVPGLGRWTWVNNSSREKGAANGLDVADGLATHWFKSRVYAPDDQFLFAHGLAPGATGRTLLAPSTNLNLSSVATRARLGRDAARSGVAALIRSLGAAAAAGDVRVEVGRLGCLVAERRAVRFVFSRSAPTKGPRCDYAFLRAGYDGSARLREAASARPATAAVLASARSGSRSPAARSSSRGTDSARPETSAGHTPYPASARSCASSFAPYADRFEPSVAAETARNLSSWDATDRKAAARARADRTRAALAHGALWASHDDGAASRASLEAKTRAIVAEKARDHDALAKALKCSAVDAAGRHDLASTQPWSSQQAFRCSRRGPPGGPRV